PEFPGVLSIKRPLVLMVEFSEAVEDILLRVTIKRRRAIDRAYTSRQDCVERLGVSQLCGVRSREGWIRARVGEKTGVHRIIGSNAEHQLRNQLRTCRLSEGVNAQKRCAEIQRVRAFEEGHVVGQTLRRCIAARGGPAIIESTRAVALRAEERSTGNRVTAPKTVESRPKLTRKDRRSVATGGCAYFINEATVDGPAMGHHVREGVAINRSGNTRCPNHDALAGCDAVLTVNCVGRRVIELVVVNKLEML